VIREEGKDAGDKPLVKAFRTPVKTGTRWGGKVAILSVSAPAIVSSPPARSSCKTARRSL